MNKTSITDAMRLCMHREPALRSPIPAPMRPASALDATESGKAPKRPTQVDYVEQGCTCHQFQRATGKHSPLCPLYDHQTDSPWQVAKLERDPGHAPLAEGQVQETAEKRIHVRVCSVRKRLLDEDNLCEKYVVDCLRAIKAIPADDPATVRIETTQRKAQKGEQEHTEISISYP